MSVRLSVCPIFSLHEDPPKGTNAASVSFFFPFQGRYTCKPRHLWLSFSICVRPSSERKTAWAISAKLGRRAVQGSRSACVRLQGQKVKCQRSRSRDFQMRCLRRCARRYDCLTVYLAGNDYVTVKRCLSNIYDKIQTGFDNSSVEKDTRS